MRLAVVASAHGYGHAARCVALADALADVSHDVVIFSAAPASVTGPRHPTVPWTVDVGLAQPHPLREDLPGTLAALDERCAPSRVDALSVRLAGFDGVVVDIAPPALEAARRARVAAVAVGNFDWAWIYAHYPPLSDWGARFRSWQAGAPAVQLWPGPPLGGFSRVVPGGLLARHIAPARPPVAGKLVLVGFGGFGMEGVADCLPVIPGVTWVITPPLPAVAREDVLWVPEAPFSALLAGADLVLTKPGYGMFGETEVAGVPVAFVPRGAFPEAPWLEAAMRARGDVEVAAVPGVDSPMRVREAVSCAVAEALDRGRRPGRHPDNAAIASAVVELLRTSA
jgi:hypothetical protein